MDQKKAIKKFKVEFNKPALNAVWEFRRGKSAAFRYGNGTSVVVYTRGSVYSVVDTRYDPSVMTDFGAWCADWLKNNLDPAFEPVFTEIEGVCE